MSQCAHNKAIHLAAEGTVSVTDISQIRKYPINFHTNPNKTEKKKHLNNNRAPTSPTSEVSSALLVTFLFQLPSPSPFHLTLLCLSTRLQEILHHIVLHRIKMFSIPQNKSTIETNPKKLNPIYNMVFASVINNVANVLHSRLHLSESLESPKTHSERNCHTLVHKYEL